MVPEWKWTTSGYLSWISNMTCAYEHVPKKTIVSDFADEVCFSPNPPEYLLCSECFKQEKSSHKSSSTMSTRLITMRNWGFFGKKQQKNKLSHMHTTRNHCAQALWDDICGNSFRIHFNALCGPKCQSSFLVSFHDFMSHIKRCSLLHNGLFKLHYRRIFPQ